MSIVSYNRTDIARAEQQVLDFLINLNFDEEREDATEPPTGRDELMDMISSSCTIKLDIDIAKIIQVLLEIGVISPLEGAKYLVETEDTLEEVYNTLIQEKNSHLHEILIELVDQVLTPDKTLSGGELTRLLQPFKTKTVAIPPAEILEELELNDYIEIDDDSQVTYAWGVMVGKEAPKGSWVKSLLPYLILMIILPSILSWFR